MRWCLMFKKKKKFHQITWAFDFDSIYIVKVSLYTYIYQSSIWKVLRRRVIIPNLKLNSGNFTQFVKLYNNSLDNTHRLEAKKS